MTSVELASEFLNGAEMRLLTAKQAAWLQSVIHLESGDEVYHKQYFIDAAGGYYEFLFWKGGAARLTWHKTPTPAQPSYDVNDLIAATERGDVDAIKRLLGVAGVQS